MAKAQADIISAVIIIIIAMGLVSSAYIWGLPLIQKRQDTALVQRAYSSFSPDNANSITKRIVTIASNGGAESFNLDVKGIWKVYACTDPLTGCNQANEPENNTLQFTMFSKVSNIAADSGWVSLSSGACGSGVAGTVGVDDPFVVCARAASLSGGYNITFKVWFREIDDISARGYKIILQPAQAGLISSTTNTLRISKGSTYTTTVGQKNLIITEIKILLG